MIFWKIIESSEIFKKYFLIFKCSNIYIKLKTLAIFWRHHRRRCDRHSRASPMVSGASSSEAEHRLTVKGVGRRIARIIKIYSLHSCMRNLMAQIEQTARYDSVLLHHDTTMLNSAQNRYVCCMEIQRLFDHDDVTVWSTVSDDPTCWYVMLTWYFGAGCWHDGWHGRHKCVSGDMAMTVMCLCSLGFSPFLYVPRSF